MHEPSSHFSPEPKPSSLSHWFSTLTRAFSFGAPPEAQPVADEPVPPKRQRTHSRSGSRSSFSASNGGSKRARLTTGDPEITPDSAMEGIESDPRFSTSCREPESELPMPPKARPKPVGLHSLSGKRKITSSSLGHPSVPKHVHFAPALESIPIKPTSPSIKRARDPVDALILGEVVSETWKEAKQEEREGRDRKRIRELEEEVSRLKTELSAKKKQPSYDVTPGFSFPLPPASLPKAAAPPPAPHAPPPPPIGYKPPRPQTVLSEARTGLRSTPPRPRHDRRSSLVGPGGDHTAFLSELSTFKLRKTASASKPLPTKPAEEPNELQQVIQRALHKKFSKPLLAAGGTPVRPKAKDVLGGAGEWDSPVVPPVPSSSATTNSETSTNTVFGQAISTDLPIPAEFVTAPALSQPPPRTSSLPSHQPTTDARPSSSLSQRPKTPSSAERLSMRPRTSPIAPDVFLGATRPVTPGRKRSRESASSPPFHVPTSREADVAVGLRASGTAGGSGEQHSRSQSVFDENGTFSLPSPPRNLLQSRARRAVMRPIENGGVVRAANEGGQKGSAEEGGRTRERGHWRYKSTSYV